MGIASERKALEKTYEGLCTISKKISKKVKGETILSDEMVIENEPCALSQVSSKYANQTETKAEASYVAKLFIAPEIEVPTGSKIIVEQYGTIYKLAQTGIPIKYPTHQEIMLLQEGIA